jgi:hypothetical protein
VAFFVSLLSHRIACNAARIKKPDRDFSRVVDFSDKKSEH